MCGIFAFLRSPYCTCDQESDLQKDLQQANKTIQHRGPDNSIFTNIDNTVSFGFHRLAINGLDSVSNQPIQIGTTIMICNGEIFNYKELATKYEFTLTTHSDCEILLHLYHKFGIKRMIQELDGEFAFVLYDTAKASLYVGRDHIGIRPLFWGTRRDGCHVFASEGKALFSLANNVRQYLPGQYTWFSTENGLYEHIQYYNYLYHQIDYPTRDYIIGQIRALLTQSVHDRMLSDRPIGCFLSGGLDSSLVTALVSKERPNIHTFTIGLEGSVDIAAAKRVAEYLNITQNHHIIHFTIEEGINVIPDLIRTLESYDITTIRASTGQYLLSRYIQRHTDIKVLLNGECIDEFGPGYLCFNFIKDPTAFQAECTRMLKNLHMYDLLRTDRTTAAHGLETRCPFASRAFIGFMMSVAYKYRQWGEGTENSMEKLLVRDAFKGLLPDKLLYRRKHAFSDGVSSKDVSWYKSVEAHARTIITPEQFETRNERFPFNTPNSYEGYWYRQLFEEIYPGQEKIIDQLWIPKLKDKHGNELTDPSATVLEGFKLDTDF